MRNDDPGAMGAAFPITPNPMNRRVHDRLCALLVAGRWALGERLDERLIAAELGVSRTPLREAIGRLVSEGALEHRPYQGNFVRTFTAKQVHDLFEVRKSLESLAAREAAEAATPDEVDDLRDIVDRCHRALDDGDLAQFESSDREFHDAVVRLARNEVLVFALRPLVLQIQLVRHAANTHAELRESTRAHRTGVVEAVRTRDGERAARLMAEHIAEVQALVAEQLVRDEPGE